MKRLLHGGSMILRKTKFIGLFFFFTLMLIFSNGFAANSLVQKNLIKASNIKSSNSYAFKRCRALSKPFDQNSDKRKAIIVGDSQGCDFLNEILENRYLSNYQIRVRFIPYPCQTVLGSNRARYIQPKNRRLCSNKRTDSLVKARKQIKQADLVIFSALWKPEVSRQMPQIINYLRLSKKQRLVVIGNKFFGKMAINKYIHMPHNELRNLRNDVGTISKDVNIILKNRLGTKAIFIDPQKLVCGEPTTCPVFTNNLHLISYDGRHLTKAGARYIGRILFQKSALKYM